MTSLRLYVSTSIAAISVAAIVLLGGTMVGLAADPPIPIGVSVAQTGPVALAGQEQVLGAQIAEEYFNKQGGVNGRPIKLVFQDAGSDEPTAINAFQNQINVAKVVGEHTTKDINVITDVWRRRLNRLWSLCGPWQEKPTPHAPARFGKLVFVQDR